MADSRRGTFEQLGWFALAAAAAVLIAVIGLHQGGEPVKNDTAATDPAPDPPTMIADLESRLRANPGDGDGWQALGSSYFQAQRYADAAGADARAARLVPGRADLWSALGEAQTLAVNSVDRIAHDAFAKALAIDPQDSRARYFLAVEKDVRGDHKGAVDDWIALLRDGPSDAPWAPSVRALIVQVAARQKIDVTGRLPAAAPVAPAPGGGEVARAAIPGPTSDQIDDAARLTPSEQDAMARGMVDRLAQRLAAQPGDLDGWIRMIRARMVLRDPRAAGEALAAARRTFARDGAALARLADAARTLGVPGG